MEVTREGGSEACSAMNDLEAKELSLLLFTACTTPNEFTAQNIAIYLQMCY